MTGPAPSPCLVSSPSSIPGWSVAKVHVDRDRQIRRDAVRAGPRAPEARLLLDDRERDHVAGGASRLGHRRAASAAT